MTDSMEIKRLRLYGTIFLGVMTLGIAGSMVIEGLSLADAFYYTIVTIATVGYGDISPTTPPGKILAVILIVGGVGTFVGVVANATELFLNRREQMARLQKLNMVIGLFFSETGTELLRFFTAADPELDVRGAEFIVRDDWGPRDYQDLRGRLKAFQMQVDPERMDFAALRAFLNDQGSLLVRLLESPYMLEHETVTDMLLAILHLKEELQLRGQFEDLPPSDLQHLCGDVKRVYMLLGRQWLNYVEQLKEHYPFLFSLALRTNPFDRSASAVVR